MTRHAALALALAFTGCDLPAPDEDEPFTPLPDDACPDGTEATTDGALSLTQVFVGGGPVYLDYTPGPLRDGEAGTCVAQNGTAAQWALLVGEERVGTLFVQVPGAGAWTLPDADVRLSWTLQAGDAVGLGGAWEVFDTGTLTAAVSAAPAGLGLRAEGVRAVSDEGVTLYADWTATAGPGGALP
jgi:hypothetical protein